MTAGLERNREMIKHATELIGKKPEVYSLARLPPDLSFEETFQNMKTLLDEWLFGAFGASEMKRESLERAQKVGPFSVSSCHSSAHLPLYIPLLIIPSPVTFVTRADNRSSPSPTSKPKFPSGPTNKTSKTSSHGLKKTRSPSLPTLL